MTPENIIRFAKEYLIDRPCVDVFNLQLFIRRRPEVNIMLPPKEIKNALDDAYVKGELDLIFSNSVTGIYKLVNK